MSRQLVFAFLAVVVACPAQAKEKEFIEMAALTATYRDVCNVPVSDEAILTAIGSAMIKYALPREKVVARATKRGKHIRDHVLKTRTQSTFCQAIKYYLDNGYPQ